MADKWRNKEKTAEEVIPLLKPGTIVCVFDTETTGLPKKDKVVKIIQFSAIRARVLDEYMLEEIDFIDLYINPEEKLAPKITEITGITDELLSYAPPEEVLAPEIFQYLNSADTWAAYNKQFDIGMLSRLADRVGFYFEEKPSVDVLEISRDWLRKGIDVPDNKLGTTYAYIYPDKPLRFHNSIEDVRATVSVMSALVPRYAELLKEKTEAKKMPRVERAYGWINPHNGRQQRIRVKLSVGEDGDIFYDCIEKCWSHKATPSAKKLFESLDIGELERQVLSKNSNAYATYTTMDQLARDRMTFLRKKESEKKRAAK